MKFHKSLIAMVGVLAVGASVAFAQSPAFFRIGTGGTAGTYYPIGGLIANAISGAEGKASPSRTSPTGRTPAPASTKARARSKTCASSPPSIPRPSMWSPARMPASTRSPT